MQNLAIAIAGLLLGGIALAQEDPENVLNEIFTARHECSRLMPQLDAAVDANPDGVKPLIERANCYYRVGRYEWVRRDLGRALPGSYQSAVDDARKDGVSADKARSVVEQGAVLQVVMHVNDDQIGAARRAYSQAQGYFGDSPGMLRAKIAVTSGQGDNTGAWRLVDEGLDRYPDDPHIFMATSEMASRDYRNITDKANAFLNQPADTVSLYNDAVTSYNTGDYTSCLMYVDQGLELLPESEHERFYQMGHACAVTANDVRRSNAFVRDLGGIDGLRPDAVIRHAAMLHDASRYDAALALLNRVDIQTAQQRDEAETLMVRSYTRKGDLDRAMQVSLAGHAMPASVANLAVQLQKAGRPEDAVQVLEPTCPRMTGNDATRCYKLLQDLQRG
ncbi:MAG: hypothetical protein AAFV53_33600 [Myxococcota bacterium]